MTQHLFKDWALTLSCILDIEHIILNCNIILVTVVVVVYVKAGAVDCLL